MFRNHEQVLAKQVQAMHKDQLIYNFTDLGVIPDVVVSKSDAVVLMRLDDVLNETMNGKFMCGPYTSMVINVYAMHNGYPLNANITFGDAHETMFEIEIRSQRGSGIVIKTPYPAQFSEQAHKLAVSLRDITLGLVSILDEYLSGAVSTIMLTIGKSVGEVRLFSEDNLAHEALAGCQAAAWRKLRFLK